MRPVVGLPALALLVTLPLMYFPERLGLASVSPWLRLAVALLGAAACGALAARLDPTERPMRVGAAVAAPAAILGAVFGIMTAMAPEHLLLVAFSTVSFVACAALAAALARGGTA